MKFTPVALTDNVNVSKTHPLIELLWLVGWLVTISGLIFLLLGITTDWAVRKTPIKVETWIGELALKEFTGKEDPALNKRLHLLLDKLPIDSPLHQYPFQVYLVDSEEINAIALPGGTIIVFTGLLQEVESENELAMILAHELGHFAHRDHLRGLGRGFGFAVAAAILLGENSTTSSIISQVLLTFNSNYSQAQEAAADQFGLDLLAKRYGHAGGATDFFSRLASAAGNQTAYLHASHPHPQARITSLQQQISEQHYRIGKTEPLQKDIKRNKSKH